ncbi:MAG TPA: DUF1854 domain-containing protein [Oscillospiraceae bacterium]|nr:DUF1854 domain-containing protein [Oscillospiraceae bacterium]
MNNENNTALSLELLSPEEIGFTENENGFLTLIISGESKGRVKLTRAYPYSMPYSYIGVYDIEDKEVGIIKDLSNLDTASETAAKKELDKRYYCPEISEIISIKEKMGSFYFEVKIDNIKKSFAVRDISRNIRFTNENFIMIFDVDGNRYIIPDLNKIRRKAKRLLEPYLY